MGSLSPQFYHLHHHQQNPLMSKSMRWFDDDEEEEEEEDNVEHYLSSSRGTGYLEDVLFHYSISKRRRLLSDSPPSQYTTTTTTTKTRTQDYWTWPSDSLQNCFHSLPHPTHCQSSTEMMKTPEEGKLMEHHSHSAASDQKESSPSDIIANINNSQWTPNSDYPHDNEKGNLYTMSTYPPSAGIEEKRKKRVVAKVVYPFALVKPGGFEGDDVATLNDINQRILMPPTRPVRHPVGDFACQPLVSPKGPGLSGKTVVAFTRVHTQGRGTITIIRTRG